MDPSTPLKYASTEDYTPALIGANSAALVIGTSAFAARLYSRIARKSQWVAADYLAIVGYCGLLVNVVANYVAAANGAFEADAPTPAEVKAFRAALASIGVAFPVGVFAAKMSLLFLFRTIFGMRLIWFQVGWWVIFALLCPIWIGLSLAYGIIGIVDPTTVATLEIGVPISSFLNAATDLMMVLLPIKVTLDLRIAWKQRVQVIFIFCLGFAATAVSLFRAGRSLVAKQEVWDPRYHLFSESAIGVIEFATIVLCSCLPVTKPLFTDLGLFSRLVSNKFLSSLNSWKGTSNYSISSRPYEEDQQPIQLSKGVIRRTDEISFESSPNYGHDGASSRSRF